MNNTPILSDKYATAPLPEICAPRHALLKLFRRAEGKRIIYISAPAGYGKTVSTQLWLKHSGRVSIWVSLDEYDNTPAIFYKLLCTGILSVQPGNKAMRDILGSPSFHSAPVEHTIRLLSEFIPDGRQYAIVLDDMHLISNKEIQKSGLLVQKRLPGSFVTVILTRNRIRAEYIKITGRENCTVIAADDLAFSAEEIQKHFKEHGRFITREESDAVRLVTDGWIIGVNALAISKKIVPGQKGGQIFKNYITQLWDSWDNDQQNFILQTAIVDVMSSELADRLTGRTDSCEILKNLCAQYFFITPAGGGTYRYHDLFLDYFRSLIERSDESFKKPLYKKAADYYLEKKEFSARKYALKSGDPEVILRSFYTFYRAETSNSADDYVSVYKSLLSNPVPMPICSEYPFLYSQYAEYYYLTGDARKMEYYMDLLYEHQAVITKSYPQFAENLVLITAVDHRTDLTQLSERFRSYPIAFNLSDRLQWSTITIQMPYIHRSIRDFYELADEKVMEMFTNSFGLLLKTQYDIAVLELRSGFLYERNRLREALDTIMQAKSAMYGKVSDELVFCGFMHLADIYSAMGNENLLAKTISETEQYIEESGSHYFRPNFEAFKIRLLLMDGDKTAAQTWLDNYFVVESEQLELYKIFQHFTTARAYMVLSQTDKAMCWLLKLKKLSEDFNRPLDIAEAAVLQAALEWALGDRKGSLGTLEMALSTMQEHGFVRVFANEGAAVLPILKRLALKLKKERDQESMDVRFLNEVMIAAYESSRRHRGITVNICAQKPVKLSKQQKHIITLLARGYKNAEIVNLTGLTIHTVKSHQAAAYAKLNVNSAMDAVIKAKELGLIE